MAKDQEFLEDMAILKDKELIKVTKEAMERGVDVVDLIENALNERGVKSYGISGRFKMGKWSRA